MAKKKQGKKAQQISQEVMDSVHSVWLAGLGALSRAEEEGGKVFRQLVDRGRRVTGAKPGDDPSAGGAATGEPAERVVDTARRAVSAVVGGAAEGARHTAERVRARGGEVTQIVEERVDEVMRRLGVPNRSEIERLTQRIEELNRRVAEMGGAAGAKAEPAAAQAPAKKATKKTAARKAPAKKATAKTAAPKKGGSKKAAKASGSAQAEEAPAPTPKPAASSEAPDEGGRKAAAKKPAAKKAASKKPASGKAAAKKSSTKKSTAGKASSGSTSAAEKS